MIDNSGHNLMHQFCRGFGFILVHVMSIPILASKEGGQPETISPSSWDRGVVAYQRRCQDTHEAETGINSGSWMPKLLFHTILLLLEMYSTFFFYI
jgi:hypothetical protein